MAGKKNVFNIIIKKEDNKETNMTAFRKKEDYRTSSPCAPIITSPST